MSEKRTWLKRKGEAADIAIDDYNALQNYFCEGLVNVLADYGKYKFRIGNKEGVKLSEKRTWLKVLWHVPHGFFNTILGMGRAKK